jgi:1-acyl-sn-glycerol-3-phosphate acyltransferase
MQQDTSIGAAEKGRREDLVVVEPYRWALSWWARLYRTALRPFDVLIHVKRFCRPFTVEGRENLKGVNGPLVIIANHTSHFDTAAALSVLPRRVWNRTAIVAAADRIYREKRKGMLFSLRYNAFPITRGGGRQALAYAEWLLHNKWSILIFPEGKRSRTGDLLPFHVGPAFLALEAGVPVLPIYIEGALHILPPGQKFARPAPVKVHIGKPLQLPEGTSVGNATKAMVLAMHDLMPEDARERSTALNRPSS